MGTKVELGNTYQCVITGFQGVAFGRADYLTGCAKILLMPRGLTAEGKEQESAWIDEQRLQLLTGDRIVLDNGSTPGGGIDAPKP